MIVTELRIDETDRLQDQYAELKHAARAVLDAYEVAGLDSALEGPMQQLRRIVAPSVPVGRWM